MLHISNFHCSFTNLKSVGNERMKLTGQILESVQELANSRVRYFHCTFMEIRSTSPVTETTVRVHLIDEHTYK